MSGNVSYSLRAEQNNLSISATGPTFIIDEALESNSDRLSDNLVKRLGFLERTDFPDQELTEIELCLSSLAAIKKGAHGFSNKGRRYFNGLLTSLTRADNELGVGIHTDFQLLEYQAKDETSVALRARMAIPTHLTDAQAAIAATDGMAVVAEATNPQDGRWQGKKGRARVYCNADFNVPFLQLGVGRQHASGIHSICTTEDVPQDVPSTVTLHGRNLKGSKQPIIYVGGLLNILQLNRLAEQAS